MGQLMTFSQRTDSKQALFDGAEVRRGLAALFAPGQVYEVRILKGATKGDKRPRTYSGYFCEADAVLASLAQFSAWEGAYVTLQECTPDLLGRAENKMLPAEKDATTNDTHITRYHWLLVDSDVRRIAGISTTGDQHALAVAQSVQIRLTLRAEGWPEPLLCDSGNGSHLLYPLDLPNAPDITDLLARVLAGLAARFDTPDLQIDRTVFNPSRICKLYGTRACKGDNTPSRPHRLARMLEVPYVEE